MEEEVTGAAACATESATQDDDGAVVASWLVVDDETASELSELLELFEEPPPPFRVRFIDNPYSSPVVVQSSSAYVTINGNEESCGSSFSDSDSSVMASVDVSGAWIFGAVEARGREADVELGGFLTDGDDGGGDATSAWVEFLGGIFD